MTSKQWLSIVMVVIGVLTASTAQLTDLFGENATRLIVSAGSILNSIMAGVLAIITGQGSVVREVQSMTGIERIVVNEDANRTLAILAMDDSQEKIQRKRGDEQAIEDTATAN